MLTRLGLCNFKSWHFVDADGLDKIQWIDLAPITGLFGTNSSGKSALLHLLLLLKQTVDSPDRSQVLNFGDEKTFVSLGAFPDIIYRHNRRSMLTMGISWNLPEQFEIVDPAKKRQVVISGREIGFLTELMESPARRVIVNRLGYKVASFEISMGRKKGTSYKYLLSPKGGKNYKLTRIRGRPWDLPPPVKCYGFPDQVKSYYQNAGFLSDFELMFEELFSRIYYLGPLREHPKRQYFWTGEQPADVGQRGEKAIDALLSSREGSEKISRGRGVKRFTLEEYVAYWLRHLELIDSFKVESLAPESNLYRVRVRKTQKSSDVLITEVGFGVSQVLPVLVLCYYVPPGSVILLEQPEIHLHPRVQAGLADVIIDAVKTRQIQVIVESHSEHLLRRLQRRIAEESFSEQDAKFYFCKNVEGTSELITLEVDLFGNILNWPEGFFGEEFEEIAAMNKAIMARKTEEAAE